MTAVKTLKPKTTTTPAVVKTLSATEKVAKMGTDYAAHTLKPGDRVIVKENGIVAGMGVIAHMCLGLYRVTMDSGEDKNYVGCQLIRIGKSKH